MMHSRERVTGGRPSCPWSPNLPWSPAANCGAYPALSEIQVSHIVAKLGGTTELFGPLYGDRRLFFVSQEGASCETKALRAGCALRAREIWLLKQLRSGVEVRLTVLFLLYRQLFGGSVNSPHTVFSPSEYPVRFLPLWHRSPRLFR